MKKFMQKKIGQSGFTLAELLIVVAVIAVLVGVAVPIFTKKLEKSREETDIANLRSAKACAAAMYLDDNENGGTYYFDAAAGVLVAANADGSAPDTIDVYGQGAEKNGGCESFKLSTNPADTTFYTATSDVRDEIIRVKISNVDEGTDYITMSWGNGEATSATVSFSANGGSGSITPMSGEIGDTITLPGKNALTAPASMKFKSWNTAADGSGTSYAAGASYTLSATETLYAQWMGEGPMFIFGQNWFDSSSAGIAKAAVTKITLQDSGVPAEYTASWDASNARNGSIMAYVVNGTEVIISGNGSGSIQANPDSNTMFANYTNLVTIEGLDLLDTSNVTNMTSFLAWTGQNTTTFSLDLSCLDVSNVTNMNGMFQNIGYNADSLSLDLSGWDTGAVTNMAYMFTGSGCNASSCSFDLSGWDTGAVTNMKHMFSCSGEKASIWNVSGISTWDTSNVTNMNSMFREAAGKVTTFNLDLSGWNTGAVTDMTDMFTSTGYSATTCSISIPASNTTTGIANDTTHFYGSTTSTYATPMQTYNFETWLWTTIPFTLVP